MATPPLPDVPCVRCRLVYQSADGSLLGQRFYLSYSGSAPTGANCTTLAGDIETQWAAHLAAVISGQYTLTEVDVLDIATTSGFSGQWTGSSSATRAGTPVPIQCATNVEFDIARRYRGGKPRMYLPPGNEGDQLNLYQWASSFVTAVNTAVSAFFTAIEALSIGSMGTLQHVNLSYYLGYTTRTTGGGQTTFKPKYRSPNAIHDNVVSYATKQEISSQRRRRTATTP